MWRCVSAAAAGARGAVRRGGRAGPAAVGCAGLPMASLPAALASSAAAGASAAAAAPLLVQSSSAGGAAVEVTFDGGRMSRFHLPWLWDNCATRINPSHKQKLMELPAPPAGLAVAAAAVVDGGRALRVDWAGGRFPTSTFDAAFLARSAYDDTGGAAAPSRPRVWTQLDEVPEFRLDEVLSDKEACCGWLEALDTVGLAVMRNTPRDRAVLTDLVESTFCCVHETIYGKTFDVVAVPDPINVAYSDAELRPHMDLLYYESPPGLQMLHCLRFDADVEGGENTFSDAFSVAETLRTEDPGAFEVLTRVRATFHKVDSQFHMRYQRPHIEVDAWGDVVAVNWSPMFEGPLQVPPEDVLPYYDAYRKFADIAYDVRRQVRMRLQPGDLVAFNNRRVLHERTGYTLPPGASADDSPRHLHGIYVGMDHFLNRTRVLRRELGRDEFAVPGRCGTHSFYRAP